MVSKEKFIDYLHIQNAGLTNMFDVRAICNYSRKGLTKEDISDIQQHYREHCNEYKVSLDSFNVDESFDYLYERK